MIRNVVLAKPRPGYDANETHNALRARLTPFIDRVARAQFEIAD